RLAALQARGLGDACLCALLPATEDMAEDGGTVGLAALCTAEHRTQHAADVAACVILLQRAEQGLGALRLAGVAAQRAHQQRQRGAARGRGLRVFDAHLLYHLPDRCTLDPRGESDVEGR